MKFTLNWWPKQWIHYQNISVRNSFSVDCWPIYVAAKHKDREIEGLPISSSMVLPPDLPLSPSTLLIRMEKALPHTPDAAKTTSISNKSCKNVWVLVVQWLEAATLASVCIYRNASFSPMRKWSGFSSYFFTTVPMKNLLPNKSGVMKVPYFAIPISYGLNSTQSAGREMREIRHDFQTKGPGFVPTGVLLCGVCMSSLCL